MGAEHEDSDVKESVRGSRRGPSWPGLLSNGTVKVALGLAFFGASTYVFTAVVLRALGPEQFADFNVFWGLAYGLGLGAMLPFEQEVSRRTSLALHSGAAGTARLAQGEGAQPSLRPADSVGSIRTAGFVVACGFAVALGVVTLIFSVFSKQHDPGILAVISVATFLSLGVAYVTRGALSGEGRFGRYSGQLFGEGAARLVLVGATVLTAMSSPWPYAMVVPVALLAAVALTSHGSRRLVPATGGLIRATTRAIGPLVLASVLSQTLVNFGPVVIRYVRDSPSAAQSGSYLAAAFIARLPIFGFAAVQAVLMPRLSRSVANRDPADFRRALARVLLPTVSLAGGSVMVVALCGPWLLSVLAGPQYHLARVDMVLLTAAYGCYLLTLILQPAAVALGRHKWSAAVWVLGSATFGVAWLLPTSATTAVSVAIGTVSVTVACGLATVVWRALARSTPHGAW